MEILETSSLTNVQKDTICTLWNQEYPKRLNYNTLADFDSYLNNLTETNHFLLINEAGQIEGWAVTFVRENQKWFAIILDGKIQGQGKGTLLLNKLKKNEVILNGWVIDHNKDIKQNGEAYQSPLKFYQKNGFIICPGNRLELEKISAVKIRWEQL